MAMKKFVYYFSMLVLLFLTSCASSKKMTSTIKQYDVETMGVGVDGTYLIKVTDYFKTTDESVYLDGLKRDAIHSVIYQGIPAGNGSVNQPALLNNDTSLEGSDEALNVFFEQKQYLNFINNVVNSSKNIVKIQGSKDYKISVTLSVNKDALRKYLIDNNIIKPLNFLF